MLIQKKIPLSYVLLISTILSFIASFVWFYHKQMVEYTKTSKFARIYIDLYELKNYTTNLNELLDYFKSNNTVKIEENLNLLYIKKNKYLDLKIDLSKQKVFESELNLIHPILINIFKIINDNNFDNNKYTADAEKYIFSQKNNILYFNKKIDKKIIVIKKQLDYLNDSLKNVIEKFMRNTGIILFYFFIFSILVSIYLSKHITKSINNTVSTVQSVTHGELNKFVPIQSDDEMALLAESFNTMIKALRNRDYKMKNQQKILADRKNELEEINKKLKDSNKIKSQFLSNMSHELRTPLNSIIGYTDVVMEEIKNVLDENQKEDLISVKRNATHLLNLINDILDLSKLESGVIEIKKSEFDIVDLLDDCISYVKPEAMKKNIYIKKVVESEKIIINFDYTKLSQIIINLLSNAVKFTDTGGVKIIYKRNPDDFVLIVKDTGIGIAEKDYDLVFKEFQQIDGSATRKYSGTGLGLTIVYSLVKLFKGNIKLNSEVDKGAEFVVKLPLF